MKTSSTSSCVEQVYSTCSSLGRLHSPLTSGLVGPRHVSHTNTPGPMCWATVSMAQSDNHPPLTQPRGRREILSVIILIAAPITLDWRSKTPTATKQSDSIINYRVMTLKLKEARSAQTCRPRQPTCQSPRRLDAGHSSLAGPPTRSGRAQAFRSRISRRFSGH